MKKLHYNKTHVLGERLCHQDNLRGSCTTVLEHVTCKKCLKSLMKKTKKTARKERVFGQFNLVRVLDAVEWGKKQI